MEIEHAALFSAVVVLYRLIVDLIAVVLVCVSGLFTNPVQVYVYIKRHAWLQTDDAVEKLCRETLAAKDASSDERIAEHILGEKGLQAIGRTPKCVLVVISSILLWALRLNFVSSSILLVFIAALLTGRMLALFGYGVLSMLRCLMGAAISRITWSDHLKRFCEYLLKAFLESVQLIDLCLTD